MIMWSSIEACASVMCASLPCYAPLLKKVGSLGTFVMSVRSVFSLPRKDSSRSVSSKRSMQKETSSSERIIPKPTVIEFSTQEDIKGGARGTDMEMGQIRLETLMDVETITRVSEPLPDVSPSPCVARAYSVGAPCYGSARNIALGNTPFYSISKADHEDQRLEHHSMT